MPVHVQHNAFGAPEGITDYVKGGLGEAARKGGKTFSHDGSIKVANGGQPTDGLLAGFHKGFESLLDFLDSKRNQGRWYAGFCPFHEDRRKPSFWLDAERDLFGCRSCDARGDVINFLARLEGWTVKDAIREMRKGMSC